MAKSATRHNRSERVESPLVVEPRWLLRAGLVMLAVAFACGYLTLCWLFYQGQWQLVLHPERTAARPARIGGLPYALVRFGPDSSGVPQRTAWSMPPSAEDRYRHLVVLYLPAGDGSLNDALPVLDGLRRLGIAVFAMNYRGYGESAAVHPSETGMREDAEAAWSYLVQEQRVSAQDVIPYGAGVGASVALGLVARHTEVTAMVMDAPVFNVSARVKADPRARFLPVDALLHDRFRMEPALAESKVAKLIFSKTTGASPEIAKAGEPKMTVEMARFDTGLFDRAIRRFLDAYAPATPAERLELKGTASSSK